MRSFSWSSKVVLSEGDRVTLSTLFTVYLEEVLSNEISIFEPPAIVSKNMVLLVLLVITVFGI